MMALPTPRSRLESLALIRWFPTPGGNSNRSSLSQKAASLSRRLPLFRRPRHAALRVREQGAHPRPPRILRLSRSSPPRRIHCSISAHIHKFVVLASCHRQLSHHGPAHRHGLRARIPNVRLERRTALQRSSPESWIGLASDVPHPSLLGCIHPLDKIPFTPIPRRKTSAELSARCVRACDNCARFMADALRTMVRMGVCHGKRPPCQLALQGFLGRHRCDYLDPLRGWTRAPPTPAEKGSRRPRGETRTAQR